MGKENRLVLVGGNKATVALDTDVTLAGDTDGAVPTQKAVKAYADSRAGDATIDTDGTMAADSDIVVPSQKAVITYVAAEIADYDTVAAHMETIDSGDAVSNAIPHTDIDNTVGGAAAVTLAAPSAVMKGKIKTITMTVDGGDVTMALTNVNNVAGASAGTTCTFDAVGDCIILAAVGAKWSVIGISGAVIS
jgi:hypothetical protein